MVRRSNHLILRSGCVPAEQSRLSAEESLQTLPFFSLLLRTLTLSSMDNQSLCEACQTIFVKNEDIQIYRHTLGGFQESATNGCYFCAMRWHRLSVEQRSELLECEHRIEVQLHDQRRTLRAQMLTVRYATVSQTRSLVSRQMSDKALGHLPLHQIQCFQRG